jgi:putative FmdB family regulatory protein
MPTYAYRCTSCQETFDVVHDMTRQVKPACPVCGGLTRRLAGPGSGVIYGEGFSRPAPSPDKGAAGRHDHEHGHDHDGHDEGHGPFPCYWDQDLDFSHSDADQDADDPQKKEHD